MNSPQTQYLQPLQQTQRWSKRPFRGRRYGGRDRDCCSSRQQFGRQRFGRPHQHRHTPREPKTGTRSLDSRSAAPRAGRRGSGESPSSQVTPTRRFRGCLTRLGPGTFRLGWSSGSWRPANRLFCHISKDHFRTSVEREAGRLSASGGGGPKRYPSSIATKKGSFFRKA